MRVADWACVTALLGPEEESALDARPSLIFGTWAWHLLVGGPGTLAAALGFSSLCPPFHPCPFRVPPSHFQPRANYREIEC